MRLSPGLFINGHSCRFRLVNGVEIDPRDVGKTIVNGKTNLAVEYGNRAF